MRLENKTVTVYGATVQQANALVCAYGLERALVYIADVRQADADVLANAIVTTGGFAEATEVDLLNLDEVTEYTAELAAWNSGIDIAVVAIRPGLGDVQLPIAKMVAGYLAGEGSRMVLVVSEKDAASPEFKRFRAEVAGAGVEVVPMLVDAS